MCRLVQHILCVDMPSHNACRSVASLVLRSAREPRSSLCLSDEPIDAVGPTERDALGGSALGGGPDAARRHDLLLTLLDTLASDRAA